MHPKFLYLTSLAISTPFCAANLGNHRSALLARYSDDQLADYLQARGIGTSEHTLYQREAPAGAYENDLYKRDVDSFVEEETDFSPALSRRDGPPELPLECEPGYGKFTVEWLDPGARKALNDHWKTLEGDYKDFTAFEQKLKDGRDGSRNHAWKPSGKFLILRATWSGWVAGWKARSQLSKPRS